ncbi:54S ribosomal protein L17 mitochondrial [Borealophlyctis nickersoniae]|nr:54S ribosomal protein L17 mitochondrial [Borealophlyctis nickersoniae]
MLRSPSSLCCRASHLLRLSRRTLATTSSPSKIHVGVLLKRDPVVLRDLTEFEEAYYRFRQGLERSEARPFNKTFHIKKGTSAEARWIAAQEAAAKAAEAMGVKDPSLAPLVQPREAELKGVAFSPRVTKADEDGAVTSLDRQLQRTLYLVVKGKGKGKWEFPAGELRGEELLHEAAPRQLGDEVGTAMDTWFVGTAPVGHHVEGNRKIFFMKAHIIAGKVTLSEKSEDHAWLTKQELASRLDPAYYESVQGMLSEL